jgi:hypothetical protein
MHSSYYLSDRQWLQICHQNVRGFRRKSNEFACLIYSDLPHLLCLTKHHFKEIEPDHTYIENYVHWAKYCRKSIQKGGVVHKSLKFTAINLDRYCSDQDIEACVIELDPTCVNIWMLAVCRSALGKINYVITHRHYTPKIT